MQHIHGWMIEEVTKVTCILTDDIRGKANVPNANL